MTNDERSYCILQAFDCISLLREDDRERERLEQFATVYAKGNPYAEKAYILEQKNKELLKELKEIKLKIKNNIPLPTVKIECDKNDDTIINVKDISNHFTKKELKEVPTLKDCKIRIKKGYYEISYRRLGFARYFVSKDLNEAKSKAYEFLSGLNTELIGKLQGENKKRKYIKFSDFAFKYMENMKKPKVAPRTYRNLLYKFDMYIKKPYQNTTFSEMSPLKLQKDLNEIHAKAPRDCEDIKSMLNGIFNYAIANGICSLNPIAAIYVPPHERTPGTALSFKEEAELLIKIENNHYKNGILLLLYTGCRGCELETLTVNFEDSTITIENKKRKRWQKEKFRTMPIFPKLKPIIKKIMSEEWNFNSNTMAADFSKNVMPGHTLKDLRHTFASRAKECGCNNEIVNYWQAHMLGIDTTSAIYTHYSMDFQRKEAKKINYKLPIIE